MADCKRKRVNLSVKKYFQRWLLFRTLTAIILSSLIAALILYFYGRQEITSSFFDAHIQLRRFSDLLLPVIAAGTLIALTSGIILSLFIPQKIAGPIFRIEQDLKTLQNGDLTSLICLREKDLLKDLAEEVNKTTIETRTRVLKSKEALASLVKAMGPTTEDHGAHGPIQELEKALARFKID